MRRFDGIKQKTRAKRGKGENTMAYKQIGFFRSLCEKIGINTAADLDQFKRETGCENASGDRLMRKMALYYAFDKKFKE